MAGETGGVAADVGDTVIIRAVDGLLLQVEPAAPQTTINPPEEAVT